MRFTEDIKVYDGETEIGHVEISPDSAHFVTEDFSVCFTMEGLREIADYLDKFAKPKGASNEEENSN
jgi:hypothetical protein